MPAVCGAMRGVADGSETLMKATGDERDERLMGLMELALSVPPEDRESYLRKACEDDSELLTEVSERLDWERKMQGFLLEPLVPRTETVRPFKPGDLINSRYEIVREVAEGGMAVVYEANDRKLEDHIAVKCPKPGFRRRLPPELRIAMKVNHRNVCRLHGIETANSPSGEVEFLTMEFLSGGTLAERMKSGALPGKEAREIAQQICHGLHEAHLQKVVHGDLKPGNIILAKDSRGTRAVITDFGLAQKVGAPGSIGTTQSGVRGTPDFVAPERWRGSPLSIESDIYGLGVILYEMVTAQRPFPDNEGVRRFDSAPVPPSKIVKGLSPVWDRVTAQCLDPDPAKRPSSAAEVARMLEPRQSTTMLSWLGALAALLTLVAGGWLWQAGKTAPAGPPVRIAVLDLQSGPDEAVVARGVMIDISERLARLAGHGNNLVVIPARESAANRNQTPEKAAAALGATHILAGTLKQSGGRYAVQAQLWEREVRHSVKDFSNDYALAEIGSLPTALVGAVSGALNLKPSGEAGTIAQPAYSDYMQGIELLRLSLDKADEAIAFLESAAAKDPSSPLPHAALAEAHVLKYRKTNDRAWLDRANNSVRKAQSLNPDVSEVLILSGLVKATAGHHLDAVKDYQRAAELNPNNSEIFRRLGNVYEDMAQPVEAVRNFRKALSLQPDYFKTYIDLGNHYFDQGDPAEARQHYLRATQLAPSVRDGFYSLGRSMLESGSFDEAEKAFLEAIRLNREGNSLMGLGMIKSYQKRHHEAVDYFRQALQPGSESTFGLTNLADSYRRTNDLAAAKQTYAKALTLATQDLAANPSSAVARAMVGYISARLGDNARAVQEIGQAMGQAPRHYVVRMRAIHTSECLGNRLESLRLVESAPRALIEKLKRDPDLSDLQANPRFIQLGSTGN